MLPLGQKKTLTKSVQLEKFLFKYKRDKFFTHIFHYVEKMQRIAKHLWITERPVILVMGELTYFMNAVKCSVQESGLLVSRLATTGAADGSKEGQGRAHLQDTS